MGKTAHCDGKRGFQIHVISFILTMAVLAVINVWTGSPYWAAWVLPGWGIGVLAHWWCVRRGASKIGAA